LSDKKVVLIKGASIAGLTAASRLAKFKYECHLIGEPYRNTEIEGFEFDFAPLFTLPATFRDFFQKTGKHFGQVLDVENCDPAFVFKFPDVEIRFANLSHSERLKELGSKLGPEVAAEWDRIIKSGEYFWDQLRENYVEWEFSLRKANIPTYLRLKAPWIKSPHLNRILGHYSTYFGYPAGIYKWSAIAAFVEESFGIWQIKGGQGALYEALTQRALELGVKFKPEKQLNFDYEIEADQVFDRPAQRLIGIENYPTDLPTRTVIFHEDGLTTDLYATKIETGKYALVLTGKLDISDFDQYAIVDQYRAEVKGNADNRLVTKIRSANRNHFKVRHLDSLAHGAIAGELLANAVRGIKNRPSHEH